MMTSKTSATAPESAFNPASVPLRKRLSRLTTRALGLRHGLSVSRIHLERLVAEFASTLPSTARVLDAGAGDSPYRTFFSHVTYEAADICKRDEHQYAHVKYVCDLRSIPSPSERFDAVLCTQVLEHVAHPQEVIQEFFRVLKPGGILWLSTPFYFEEHEVPYDFYRYTQFGLRHLVETAGFDLQHIGWVGGYFYTLSHQLNLARHQLPHRVSDYGGGTSGAIAAGLSTCLRPFLGLLALHFAKADLRHQYNTAGHPVDYYIIVKKPQTFTQMRSPYAVSQLEP